ncbi:MAG: DUF1559 domain-containing protein, partial [Pirellulaceae bacterium]
PPQPASRTVVPFFLCPSDREAGNTNYVDNGVWAPTNYMFNAGTGEDTPTGVRQYQLQNPNDGLVWYTSSTRLADILDGTTQTLLTGEAALGDMLTSTSPPVGPKIKKTLISVGGTNLVSDVLCASYTAFAGRRGRAWIRGTAMNSTFNTHHLPNQKVVDCVSNGMGFVKASSWHAGGVQVGLCDGSVRFVSDTIHHGTWRALSTRQGGEVLGEY